MMKKTFYLSALSASVMLALQGCMEGSAGGSNFDIYAENMVVDAGANIAATANSLVHLSGTAYNENRMITSMSWVIKKGVDDPNANVSLMGGLCDFKSQNQSQNMSSSSQASAGSGKWKDVKNCQATLNIGPLPTDQQVVLLLTAVDSDGHSRSDEVTVFIKSSREDLVVDAGADINVGAGTKVTTLCHYKGGFWYDRNHPKPLFRWYIKNAHELQLKGVNASLTWDSNTGSMSFTAPDKLTTDADAHLACEVTDEAGSVAEDVVVFHIKGLDPLIVSAGDIQVVEPNSIVTLKATVEDPSGGKGPYYYMWKQISGPSVTLANENTATASFMAPSSNTDLSFQVSVSRNPIDSNTTFATTEQAVTTVSVRAAASP